MTSAFLRLKPRELRDAAAEISLRRATQFADQWRKKAVECDRFVRIALISTTAGRAFYVDLIDTLRSCWLRVRYTILMIRQLRETGANVDLKIGELRVFRKVFARYNDQRCRFERLYDPR